MDTQKKTAAGDYYIQLLLAFARCFSHGSGYFLMNILIYDEMQEMNTESRNRDVINLTIAAKFYVGKNFHLDKTLALIL